MQVEFSGGVCIPDFQKHVEKYKALLEWQMKKIDLSCDWIDNSQTQISRHPIQGAIHQCQLGENIGNEQGEHRPVLIVSNNTMNSTSGNVVIVPLTKSLKTKTVNGRIVPRYPTNYFLYTNNYSFLQHDSAVLANEVRSISKVRLGAHLGSIDQDDLEKVLARLKRVIGL